MPNERITLAVRGEWLELDLELDFPPGNAAAALSQPAAEELWLASRVVALVGRYHAGRAARRVPLGQMVAPTAEHHDALGYLEEVAPMTADEDLALALDADELHELEEHLSDGDTIADAYDEHDEHDHADDEEADDDELKPDEGTGLADEPDRVADVIERIREERRAPRPPTVTEPGGIDRDALMRACLRLTPLEKLNPGRALVRELGIAPNLAGTAVQTARRNGWLPIVERIGTQEADA